MPPLPQHHRNSPVRNLPRPASLQQVSPLPIRQLRQDTIPPAGRTRRLQPTLRFKKLVHAVPLPVDDGVNATVNYRRRNHPIRDICRRQPSRKSGIGLRRSEMRCAASSPFSATTPLERGCGSSVSTCATQR